jgi:hypothetical protein
LRQTKPTTTRRTQWPHAGRVQKNFAARVAEIREDLAPGTPVEVWFQDEMRVGRKNKLTYRWARTGSRKN